MIGTPKWQLTSEKTHIATKCRGGGRLPVGYLMFSVAYEMGQRTDSDGISVLSLADQDVHRNMSDKAAI